LSHELRNPLAGIHGAVHLLRGNAPVDTKALVDGIGRQTANLVRIVDDLLDVSRISKGKIQLKREVLELQTVLARAVESARLVAEQRNHQLSVDIPEQPMRVFADATRLEQIVLNLLINAAKYTEPGGRISLEARPTGDEVVIAVRDTGIGIPHDMQGRIFDLFVQEDRSLDRSRGGLGVGLTLVKRLTEMHGGRVLVDSAGPGAGSEFSVYLPLFEARPVGAMQAVESPRGHPVPLRVLVVDDNQDVATSLSLVLASEGYKVQVAHDGKAAVTLATRFLPDVVLLDIGLPGLDGYGVIECLKPVPELRGTVFVAISGYGREEDQQRSLRAGFWRHLVKPIDYPNLKDLLRALAPGAPGVPEMAPVLSY
jgi:CheY-like chemotaxis protein